MDTTPPPPDPLRLAAACCAPDLTPAQGETVRALAAGADWDIVARLFRRHRIEGLAWRALSQGGGGLPPELAGPLQARADQAKATNMQAAVAMARLQRRFADANVDLLFIKGLTLGQLAYGNPLVKSAWDIDILVAEGAVAEAAGLLAAEGFTCIIPEPRDGMEGLLRWHATAKESVWRDAGGRVIELHDGLADHPLLIPGIGMASPAQARRVERLVPAEMARGHGGPPVPPDAGRGGATARCRGNDGCRASEHADLASV